MKFVNFLLKILPTYLSAKVLDKLVSKPYPYRPKPTDFEILKKGEQFSYGNNLVGWKWGTGPLVVLVHGWGGAAMQWGVMISEIVNAGFTVVAPDISGHGSSKGNRISFDLFSSNLNTLNTVLKSQEIHAYIGHSASGLAIMAGRSLHGLKAKKYICIAAPSYPYPPYKAAKKLLNIPNPVVEKYKLILAKQFQTEWCNITKKSFEPCENSDLLLIYDRTDKYLDSDDVERISEIWPSAQVYKTENIGHEKLIRSPTTIDQVTSFLNA